MPGLVCQTSFRKGGRLRRAPRRSRKVCGRGGWGGRAPLLYPRGREDLLSFPVAEENDQLTRGGPASPPGRSTRDRPPVVLYFGRDPPRRNQNPLPLYPELRQCA